MEEILRNKANEVAKVVMDYVNDLEEEYPQELWTMLSILCNIESLTG